MSPERKEPTSPPQEAREGTPGQREIAQQQAQLLSYLDGFKALAVIFLLLLPVVFLARPGAAAARAAS